MKNNKLKTVTNADQIRKMVKQEVALQYDEIYKECAENIMWQTLASVLLCLERTRDYREKRLKDFLNDLKNWIDVMNEPTDLNGKWNNNDNIIYFKEFYSYVTRREFTYDHWNACMPCILRFLLCFRNSVHVL